MLYKYNGWTDLSKKDFSNRKEWREYKKDRNNEKKSARELAKSLIAELKVQRAIDNMKNIDPDKFNLVNNLNFIDSKGATKSIDINVYSGNARNEGGGKTAVSFGTRDKKFETINRIIVTLDFIVIKPESQVLAHEFGHAYNAAKNPERAMQKEPIHNCQDPANRDSFQSKTAMDWQDSYLKNKDALESKKRKAKNEK
jgi:hypothetical protein